MSARLAILAGALLAAITYGFIALELTDSSAWMLGAALVGGVATFLLLFSIVRPPQDPDGW